MEDQTKRGLNSRKDERKVRIDQRKSDATSDETLSEIEETEDDSNSEASTHDPGPSPDGLLDEPDELKDAGPM
jgi:hypothetical protein